MKLAETVLSEPLLCSWSGKNDIFEPSATRVVGLKGLTKYFEIMVGAAFRKNLGTPMPEESGNSCFLKSQGF